MIFTKQNSRVEVLARCGVHKVGKGADMLVQVKFLDDPHRRIRHVWSKNLKADSGEHELVATVGMAPEKRLEGADLEMAFAEAR
jgi:hypothetical protein